MENSIGTNIDKQNKVINVDTSRKPVPVKFGCRNNCVRSNTDIIKY